MLDEISAMRADALHVATTTFLQVGGVEAALNDARRLLTVASLPSVGMEFAAPVIDAASAQMAIVIEATETAAVADDMSALIADAEERLADAVSATVEANEGGAAEVAREAIGAALAAVGALIEAATVEHGEFRVAA